MVQPGEVQLSPSLSLEAECWFILGFTFGLVELALSSGSRVSGRLQAAVSVSSL